MCAGSGTSLKEGLLAGFLNELEFSSRVNWFQLLPIRVRLLFRRARWIHQDGSVESLM